MTKEDILTQRRIIRRARWTRYMRNLSLFALIAEVFLLALSPPAATVAMLVGVVAMLVRRRIDGEFRFRALPMDLPAGIFVVVGALSILVSPDRAFSFYNYYNLVGAYVLTYLLAGQIVRTPRELRLVLAALGLSAIIVLAVGFWQFAFGIDTSQMKWVDGDAFPELKKRVFSTWENPNILAGYLDMMICLAFGFFVQCGGLKKRIILGAFILLLAACLAMTYARGAMLVIAVILVLYGILRDWRVLLACVVLGGGVLYFDPVLYDRIISVFTRVDTSMEMRMALWESTIQMIQDHPFLGIGWGVFFKVYPEYDFYLQGAPVLIVHAHNMYLNYMAEIGLAGAGAFFWFFFGSIYTAIRTALPAPAVTPQRPLSPAAEELADIEESIYDDVTHPDSLLTDFRKWGDRDLLAGLRLGLVLAFVSVALNGLTDDLLFNIPTSMMVWLFAAIAGSLSLIELPVEVTEPVKDILPGNLAEGIGKQEEAEGEAADSDEEADGEAEGSSGDDGAADGGKPSEEASEEADRADETAAEGGAAGEKPDGDKTAVGKDAGTAEDDFSADAEKDDAGKQEKQATGTNDKGEGQEKKSPSKERDTGTEKEHGNEGGRL